MAARAGGPAEDNAGMARTETEPARILVVGGGYVGMYSALRLQATLNRGEASVTSGQRPEGRLRPRRVVQ